MKLRSREIKPNSNLKSDKRETVKMEGSNVLLSQNKSLDGVSLTRTETDDRQKRTEFSELPHHNGATPSRPITPDESVIDGGRTVAVSAGNYEDSSVKVV